MSVSGAESPAAAVIEVEGLVKKFGEFRAVDHISFAVAEGVVFAFLGPNGAGKTTLLRALQGLMPYRGSVHWHARNISYLPPQESLQRQNLPPLTIAEFYAFKKPRAETVKAMLEQVGLDESLLARSFGELSTGQFQRMMMGWALLDQPDVLILDEPTSGIDIGGEETIYSLLHRFRQQHELTIVLVTHDLHVVWEYATQVLCLNKQQMCMGKPDQVLTPEQLKRLYGTGIKFYQHQHG